MRFAQGVQSIDPENLALSNLLAFFIVHLLVSRVRLGVLLSFWLLLNAITTFILLVDIIEPSLLLVLFTIFRLFVLPDLCVLDISLVVIDLFSLGLTENQNFEGSIVRNAVANVDSVL